MASMNQRHYRYGMAVLLATASALIGLAIVVAREARQAMRSPQKEALLFPGFTVDELPRPKRGLVVTSLQSASEAQFDGIVVGDEILAIDNHSVGSLEEAEQILNQNRQASLSLRLLHNRDSRDVTLHQNGVSRHGT